MESIVNEQLFNLTLHNDDSDSSDEYSTDSDPSTGDTDAKTTEIDEKQTIVYTDIEGDDGYVIISSTAES